MTGPITSAVRVATIIALAVADATAPADPTALGVDPDVGDITYYAPWGNLAIFYRDFGYSSGLVKLGHVDSGVEKLATHSGTFPLRIELAETAK